MRRQNDIRYLTPRGFSREESAVERIDRTAQVGRESLLCPEHNEEGGQWLGRKMGSSWPPPVPWVHTGMEASSFRAFAGTVKTDRSDGAWSFLTNGIALEQNQAGLQIKWNGEGAVLLGESGNDKQKKKRAMNVQ